MTASPTTTTTSTSEARTRRDLPGSGRTALVTGASSGIGASTARTLLDLGYTVFGAARRTDRLAALTADGLHPVTLDLTDENSVHAAVETVLATTGRIDVLVNNAGYGSYGAIEDVELDEARRQFEVNVFGLAALTRLVIPGMRERRSGTIINVSSMGGRLTTPLGGWYHATKYAVEALSDALRMELQPFGVDVVVIEPGGIRTEWSSIAADHLEASSRGSAYATQAEAVARTMRNERLTRLQSDPKVIARAVGRAVTARRPRTRYLIGFSAKPLVAMRRLLPDRAFDLMIGLTTGTQG